MQGVKSAADNGSDVHQLNCYGIVFPENCDTYNGPHSVECLTTIWKSKGCLNKGSKSPINLDSAEKHDLDLLNVDRVSENFEMAHVKANNGHDNKELECYGMVFPENCTSYFGPHSIECLISIWEEVDCKVKGYRHPNNLTTDDINSLGILNLTAVKENIESIKLAADGGNEEHQLNCYGVVFPNNCSTYHGQHSVECLTTIWLLKGCLHEGTKAPIKLDHTELHDVDVLYLSDVMDIFKTIQIEANSGDEDKELECYGLVFPENCVSYYGPHSIDCLITIWEEVDCKVKGYRYPSILTTSDAQALKSLNLSVS
uniref:uncharacterized protein LOC113474930 n=1 Tax=Ciona intestinalis TaxID=7719 RepID=UPI000EF4A91B|nr:uncharacterized protein LOC113474930 [Ciona intestinalis]|eukprot:XP_026693802.1 uncharacterized protein LOC113474930 [Ciona intestinalis]